MTGNEILQLQKTLSQSPEKDLVDIVIYTAIEILSRADKGGMVIDQSFKGGGAAVISIGLGNNMEGARICCRGSIEHYFRDLLERNSED